MSGKEPKKPVVFLGPSLPVKEAEARLEAYFLPPASQGSIVSAVQTFEPSAILLIDGVFQNEPAVRHKEILWALSRGIPVFGAASMGALRAAELYPYGMIGIGLIYRWYRRYPLLADDAVAVLHAPAEVGSQPLTHSLIDLRMTARAAERAGLIDRATRDALEIAARGLNFRERTLPRMIDRAFGQSTSDNRRSQLTNLLFTSFASRKKIDAIAAIDKIKNLVTCRAFQRIHFDNFVMTNAFLRDLRHSGITLR